MDGGVDDNPRPLKRHRSSLSMVGSGEPDKPLCHIPLAALLLSVPALVVHPPSHRHHSQSIALAQHSLRRCLQINGLDPVSECRAWTGLAELGLGALVSGNHSQLGEVEKALTKGLLIAQKHPSLHLYVSHITQLSAQVAHFQKNTRFAQHSLRRLISSFSNEQPHAVASTQLSLIHSLWLDADSGIANSSNQPSGLNPALAKCLRAIQDLHDLSLSFGKCDKLDSGSKPATPLTLLSHLLRLQVLVRHGVWSQVPNALAVAEATFGSYDQGGIEGLAETLSKSPVDISTTPASPTPTKAHRHSKRLPPPLQVQLLILAVHVHTYFGDAGAAAERLSLLHALIDEGILANGDDTKGTYMVSLTSSQSSEESTIDCRPLYLKATHPRIVYTLTFLLSAATKRDAVGRKPRKAVFAREGLAVLDRELGFDASHSSSSSQGLSVSGKEKEISLPAYAPLGDMVQVRTKMVKMKADLLCEIINVSIMRSEFKEAEQALNELIAHTRTYDLFPAYAARITLQQAQFAHSLGHSERARQCYELAAWLAEGKGSSVSTAPPSKPKTLLTECRDDWVRVAARAGALWVRIGVLRSSSANSAESDLRGAKGDIEMSDFGSEDTRVGSSPAPGRRGSDVELQALRALGKEVVSECAGMGGTLAAIGELLAACLHVELWGAKQHLRRALDLATKAQDNHLRALILALSASHYLHTARDNALTMLGTCEQIAAGLGAVSKKAATASQEPEPNSNEHVGNARMRLWVGKRTLELHKWAGDSQKSARQTAINKQLKEAVDSIEKGPLKRTLNCIS